jgi:hypothetical protein
MADSDRWLKQTFLESPTVRAAIEKIMSDLALFLTDPEHPPGCLLSCGGVNLEADDERIEKALRTSRRSREALLVWNLRHAQATGELPPHLSPRIFAAYIQTVIQGMSAMARDGASRAQLAEVARLALVSWPEPTL